MTLSRARKRSRNNGTEDDPPTSPKDLISLPTEILRRIALFLDRSDALSFSRPSPTLTIPAEPAIWCNIELLIGLSYGTQPLIAPCTEREDAERYFKWVIEVSKEAERQRGIALKRTINGLLMSLDERKLGYVESLDVVPRRGANTALVQLLDLLSPVLKKLSLHAEVRSSHRRLGIKDHEKLSFKLLDFGVLGTTFSNLTHLTLDYVLDYYDELALICNIAPNLEFLDVTFSETARTHWIEDVPQMDIPDKPIHHRNTRIKHLRLSPDIEGVENDMSAAPQICALLKASPELEILSLYMLDLDERCIGLVQESLKDHTKLKDLRMWQTSSHIFCNDQRNWLTERTFTAVETCVLWLNDILSGGRTPNIDIPRMPQLKNLYLMHDGDIERVAPGVPYDPSASAFRRLTSTEAANMRFTSHLEIIHLASLNQNDETPDTFVPIVGRYVDNVPVCSKIFSYRYLDRELLHVRTYDRSVMIQDAPIDQPPIGYMNLGEGMLESVGYFDDTGAERRQDFRFGKDMAWEDATEYDGEGIPLEVIARMREAAGMEVQEWEKRGVQVSEEVWQILEDYLADQHSAVV